VLKSPAVTIRSYTTAQNEIYKMFYQQTLTIDTLLHVLGRGVKHTHFSVLSVSLNLVLRAAE